MIKFVEESISHKFCEILDCSGYLGARIKTQYEVYHNISKTACFWVLDDGAVSLLDGFCTIVANQNCDFEELSALLSISAVDTISCDEFVAEQMQKYMSFSSHKKGSLLEYRKDTTYPIPFITTINNASFKAVYKTLTISNAGMEEELPYDYWLSDISLKTRRGVAKIYSVMRDDEVISTATIIGKSKNYAQIGGVATHPNYRFRGYSTAILKQIINECVQNGIIPTLLTDSDVAYNMYKHLGFDDVGVCFELKI